MKNMNWPVTIIIAIIVAGAAFFGGMQYQKSQRPNYASLNTSQGAAGGYGRRFGGVGGSNGMMRPIVGQIISTGTNTVTVQLPDGSSKILLLSSNTTINKQTTGSQSDLITGTRVAVVGTTNSDGSVSAQAIQLNPMVRGLNNASTPTPTP